MSDKKGKRAWNFGASGKKGGDLIAEAGKSTSLVAKSTN